MKQILLNIMVALAVTALPAGVLSGTAYAACGSNSSAKGQVLRGISETGSNCNDSGVTDVIHAAVLILSFAAGIIAVIMVIVAGFKYMTSGGDSGKVANAKNTLIYALVGIAIAAL